MGSIHTQMLLKALAAGAPGRAPSMLASLTRRVENNINAIEKWVPFSPKCSQKLWRLGLCPRPTNSEREHLRRLPVWPVEGEGRQFPSPPPGARNPWYATDDMLGVQWDTFIAQLIWNVLAGQWGVSDLSRICGWADITKLEEILINSLQNSSNLFLFFANHWMV